MFVINPAEDTARYFQNDSPKSISKTTLQNLFRKHTWFKHIYIQILPRKLPGAPSNFDLTTPANKGNCCISQRAQKEEPLRDPAEKYERERERERERYADNGLVAQLCVTRDLASACVCVCVCIYARVQHWPLNIRGHEEATLGRPNQRIAKARAECKINGDGESTWTAGAHTGLFYYARGYWCVRDSGEQYRRACIVINLQSEESIES